MKRYFLRLSGLLKRPTIKLLLVALLSVVISYLYFGHNLKAEMGIIDDHNYIARGVLHDRSLVWSNFKNAPEIQSFGDSSRFRIIYNLIHDIEAAEFGFNAPYFYLVNIVIFAFFIFCVFYITYKNLGMKWSMPFAIFVVGQSYFAHIFTRLWTAEAWAILGLSVYALGFNSIYIKSKKAKIFSSWKECLVMVLGAVIMIGSKENFAIIGVLVITLLVMLNIKKKLTKAVLVSSFFILLFNLYQVLNISLTQQKQGVDFYQNDAGTLSRIAKNFSGAFSGEALYLSLLFFIIIAVICACLYVESKKLKVKLRDKRLTKIYSQTLIVVSILAIFYLFNLYTYNGVLYSAHRYAFPSILVGQLLLLIFIKWAYDFSKKYFVKVNHEFFEIAYIVMLVGLSILMIKNLAYSRQMSEINVVATTSFQKKLKEIIYNIEKHPDYPIVFSTYQPFDYEPLISTSLYLKYYGIERKPMIKTNYDLLKIGNEPLTKWVANENIKLEKNGDGNFASYDKGLSNQCLNIDFSEKTTGGNCENLGKIWRLGSYPY